MKEYRQKFVPCLSVPELDRHSGYTAEYWAFDERIDKFGNKVCGFFVDLETFDTSIVEGHDEPIVATILCKLPVYYVRWTYESGRIEDGCQRRTNQPNLPRAVVYRIENSEVIEWFCEQSSHIHDDENLCHYEFSTDDDVIDIISTEEPILFESWKEG